MTTAEIASVLASKIQFNTFGGNPVCSAGGLAVLNVIDREKRQSHCAEVGSHLIQRLKDLQKRHDSKCKQNSLLSFFLYQILYSVFSLYRAALFGFQSLEM